jgi:hypothetical protein
MAGETQIEVRNAVIEEVEIRFVMVRKSADQEPTAQACFELVLDYGDATQRTGNVPLTGKSLARLLSITGVREWSAVVGKVVRARIVPRALLGQSYGTVDAIGHVIHEEWLPLDERSMDHD